MLCPCMSNEFASVHLTVLLTVLLKKTLLFCILECDIKNESMLPDVNILTPILSGFIDGADLNKYIGLK